MGLVCGDRGQFPLCSWPASAFESDTYVKIPRETAKSEKPLPVVDSGLSPDEMYYVERETRLELATHGLEGRCATIALLPHGSIIPA